MALLELWKNKLRTFLSLFGVTIGIFCIIGVLATVNSLEQNIQNEVKSLGNNTIFVDKWDYSGGPGNAWWKYVNRPTPKYYEVKQIKESKGVKDGTWLNMALTDGHSLVAARYVSDPAETPLTLYYSSGSRYVVENGTCRMEHAEAHNAAVLVVSEKLTKTEKDWNLVPANHFVLVSPGGDVDLQKIDA